MSGTLLERIAAGDGSAVRECLSRYGGLVWSLAQKQASDVNDVEDAVQEVFIDLWKNAGRFDPRLSSEPTFVAVIARRRLIDRSRKNRRRPESVGLPPDGGPVVAPSSDGPAAADELEKVRAKLDELRPEQRLVLEMAIDQGLSQSEIAQALDIPLGTVKAHARRGLIRLRELVGVNPEPSAIPNPNHKGSPNQLTKGGVS